MHELQKLTPQNAIQWLISPDLHKSKIVYGVIYYITDSYELKHLVSRWEVTGALLNKN